MNVKINFQIDEENVHLFSLIIPASLELIVLIWTITRSSLFLHFLME